MNYKLPWHCQAHSYKYFVLPGQLDREIYRQIDRQIDNLKINLKRCFSHFKKSLTPCMEINRYIKRQLNIQNQIPKKMWLDI